MNDITAIKGIDGLHGNSFTESGVKLVDYNKVRIVE